MKHLLFLLDYYAPHKGGIENVFEQLIFRLLKKQYHITLLTSRFDESLPEKEVQGNLTIQRIGRERKSFFFQALRVGAKILREHPQIEVIHSSTYTSAIPASILGMLFSKKTLLTIHEIFGKLRTTFKPRYSRRIFQLFEWLTFQFPHDVYHCVSLYTLNSVRLVYGIPDEKLHLIYNGVDTDFWDAGEVSEERKRQLRKKFWWEGKYLMLYYGHSGMSKGIDYLVEAIPEILQGNPDGVLIFNLIPAKRDREIREKIIRYSEAVVAYPPDKGCRDALIKRPNPMEGGLSTKKSPLPHFPAVLTGHSMKGGVYIFDEQPQVVLRELVATADIVIAPSLAEGFGSVHSETCAMGKVLLTTQVAAIPEVVSGQVKFISPSSREAIVQGIKEIREGNIESIPSKTFNREESVEKIEQLYQP